MRRTKEVKSQTLQRSLTLWFLSGLDLAERFGSTALFAHEMMSVGHEKQTRYDQPSLQMTFLFTNVYAHSARYGDQLIGLFWIFR